MAQTTRRVNLREVVEAFRDRALRNAREVVVIGFQEACLEIVQNWPVVTGHSRRSWYTSVNTLPQGPPGGTEPEASLLAAFAGFELGGTLYFGNTAVYSRRLEFGFVGEDSLGRHYNQQGRFIMTRAADRLPDFVRAAAANVNAGGSGFASLS